MRNVKSIAQWMFAVFVAIASWFCLFLLLALLYGRLQGAPWGAKLPPGFHSTWNPIVLRIAVDTMLYLPLVVASYLGGIAAPKSQLRAASFVFPCLVCSLFFIAPSLVTGKWGTSIQALLETGSACAIAAALLHFRWKRRGSSGISSVQSAPLTAVQGIEP
jgi:hypothetical protein